MLTGPLRGIPRLDVGNSSFKTPSRTPARAPVNRKDGGIKMLDIAEQPFGRDSKRKKKNPDEKEKEDKTSDSETTPTPDYAAGLTSMMIPPSPAPAAYSGVQEPSSGMSSSPSPFHLLITISLHKQLKRRHRIELEQQQSLIRQPVPSRARLLSQPKMHLLSFKPLRSSSLHT